MDIKKSFMRETMNQVVLNKTLRRLAVKKLDKMLHNALINGYGISALPEEKKFSQHSEMQWNQWNLKLLK